MSFARFRYLGLALCMLGCALGKTGASPTTDPPQASGIPPTDGGPPGANPPSNDPADGGVASQAPYRLLGAVVGPSLAEPGATLSIAAAVSGSVASSNVNVDLEIRDMSGRQIAQKTFSNESFAPDQVKAYAWDYVLPATMLQGNYRLTVGVFNATWSMVYMWNDNAAPLRVASDLSDPSTVLPLPGVNLSGAEYNGAKAGARVDIDYVYPTPFEMDYFSAKGFKVIRVPFDIERLQPQRGGPLDPNEFGFLDRVVKYAASKHLSVILDPYAFGYLRDAAGVSRAVGSDPLMPASSLASFWSLLARAYVDQSNVIFGLMDEPHKQTPTEWRAVAEASVAAIRATGATQKILVPGTAWTSAHSWVGSGNAAAWVGFRDSNFAFEVHQYLDGDSSGTNKECGAGMGTNSLRTFTDWARANHYKAFLGEFGWSVDPTCPLEAEALLAALSTNSDVWLGYTYWSAGPWMGSSNMFTLEPVKTTADAVLDRPQLSILVRHL